jgi:molecular chaperone GrpE
VDTGPEEPIVRDRRRIDPETGQVRPTSAGSADGVPSAAAEPGGGAEPEQVASLRNQIGERTADLQRLKAEFDNYRRRAERDRAAAGDQAISKLLTDLLGVLDDIGRARDHGDLEGPFKAIAESLETVLEATGLERFGTPGEEFDPHLHHALLHSYRADVTQTTCVEIFRAGYRRGNVVLRAAQVAVAEPAEEVTQSSDDEAGAGISDRVTDVGDGGFGEAAFTDAGFGDAGFGDARDSAAGSTSGSTSSEPGARPVPDDTGSVPGPDRGGPTVSAD